MKGEGRTKYAFREGYVQTTITLSGLSFRNKLQMAWAILRGRDVVIEEHERIKK